MNAIVEIEPLSLAEYSHTAAALAELRARLANVAYDVSTTKGLDIAKKDRAEVRGLRRALEDKRVELKAPALERSRLIDAEAKALTAELLALETPIDQQIKAEEKRKESEKAAREQAEREAAAVIQERIDKLRSFPVMAAGCHAADIQKSIGEVTAIEVTLESFGERAGEAAQVKAQMLARLGELHAAAVAHEAEQERLAAERIELARERAELEAQQRAAREAEQDRLDAIAKQQREAAAAEQRRLDEEAAARRAAEEAKHAADQRIRDAAPVMLAALQIVRDAYDDCQRDGIATIPAMARQVIGDAIELATVEQA